MVIDFRILCLFVYAAAVHLYAGIGTHRGAGCAAYATLGSRCVGKVIAAVINIDSLESQHIARTRHHTQITTLASFAVDCDSSNYFCHVVSFRVYIAKVTKTFSFSKKYRSPIFLLPTILYNYSLHIDTE